MKQIETNSLNIYDTLYSPKGLNYLDLILNNKEHNQAFVKNRSAASIIFDGQDTPRGKLLYDKVLAKEDSYKELFNTWCKTELGDNQVKPNYTGTINDPQSILNILDAEEQSLEINKHNMQSEDFLNNINLWNNICTQDTTGIIHKDVTRADNTLELYHAEIPAVKVATHLSGLDVTRFNTFKDLVYDTDSIEIVKNCESAMDVLCKTEYAFLNNLDDKQTNDFLNSNPDVVDNLCNNIDNYKIYDSVLVDYTGFNKNTTYDINILSKNEINIINNTYPVSGYYSTNYISPIIWYSDFSKYVYAFVSSADYKLCTVICNADGTVYAKNTSTYTAEKPRSYNSGYNSYDYMPIVHILDETTDTFVVVYGSGGAANYSAYDRNLLTFLTMQKDTPVHVYTHATQSHQTHLQYQTRQYTYKDYFIHIVPSYLYIYDYKNNSLKLEISGSFGRPEFFNESIYAYKSTYNSEARTTLTLYRYAINFEDFTYSTYSATVQSVNAVRKTSGVMTAQVIGVAHGDLYFLLHEYGQNSSNTSYYDNVYRFCKIKADFTTESITVIKQLNKLYVTINTNHALPYAINLPSVNYEREQFLIAYWKTPTAIGSTARLHFIDQNGDIVKSVSDFTSVHDQIQYMYIYPVIDKKRYFYYQCRYYANNTSHTDNTAYGLRSFL